MRWCLLAALVTGCSFDVGGTNVDPSGGSPPSTPASPPQSAPNGPDAGAPAPPTPTNPTPPAPPAMTPDMAQQRIGTACKADSDCDPGLICAQTFLVGLQKIDIPGGYCTHECSMSACPANSFCGSFSFGKYCLSSCPPDPCRNDYKCCANSKMNACLPDDLCPMGGD
ncbi:MAG TPA: hypothetical protein VGL86_33075 [Polyangia bacterium]|jgi:hypothetical protein